MLSRKAKESIKTALAMTIAYGIALSMDWDKPYWAGFAVAFISLATVGLSLNKAALRVVGTIVATAIALLLIALFAQDRWPFMLALSIWVFLCTYMMGSVKYSYFWYVSGFVCVVICMGAGPDPVHAFEIAVLRSQETGLGILVYSLVALLLWPVSSRADFEDSVGKLAATQHQLYLSYFALMSGKGNPEEAQSLSAQYIHDKSRFNELLTAAESDSQEVREMRPTWRRYRALVGDFNETLARWRESLADLQTVDLLHLVPGLADFGHEIDRRLSCIEDMIAGKSPEHPPAAIELTVNREAVNALPNFHRAAMVVSRKLLINIEALTRSMFDVVSELRDCSRGDRPQSAPVTPSPNTPLLPDLERMGTAVRVVIILWSVWLAVIYINGIPGGTGLVSMAVCFIAVHADRQQRPVCRHAVFLRHAETVRFHGPRPADLYHHLQHLLPVRGTPENAWPGIRTGDVSGHRRHIQSSDLQLPRGCQYRADVPYFIPDIRNYRAHALLFPSRAGHSAPARALLPQQ
jgi:uncharacterized membrane protein YccC